MQSPREILADLWNSSGGDPTALDTVTLTGEEPQLPSSFRVAAAAQVIGLPGHPGDARRVIGERTENAHDACTVP